jgi:hypothetical protein
VTAIATTTATTKHVVRLVHSATGKVISAVRLGPSAWPTGWWARVVDGTVVVVASSAAAGPASIDIIVTDGTLVPLLDLPTPVANQPADSVRVPLAAPEIDVPIDPVALTLTVSLLAATGPSAGKSVTVRGASGSPTVTLSQGDPGVYSATRVWGANLINADLRVGSTTVRKVSLDYGHTETHLYVVDPT